MAHIVILTRQIGHYHDARFRSTAKAVERLTVVSTANRGGFAEFLASETEGYDVVRLFPDRLTYDAAVAHGQISDALTAALDQLLPDTLAIAGWTTPESMAAIRWCRKNSVPIVIMSESQADDANRSRIRETIKSRIVSLCDAAIVGGPPHAAYIADLGIPKERIYFGHNAVDNTHFKVGAATARSTKQSKIDVGFDLPDRYILASARFIQKKNLPTLVSSYSAAVQDVNDLAPDLVILGDGETKTDIQQAADASGVSNRLHLPGFVGYDLLPSIYGLADAFVHVAIAEQWGLVVNEAMASGLPTIVSEPCGVARTVVEDGISGIVVKPYTEAIRSGLVRLFLMPVADRAKMGEAAGNAIASWGPERFASGLVSAVDDAMSAPRRRRPAPWDSFILGQMERRIIERVA